MFDSPVTMRHPAVLHRLSDGKAGPRQAENDWQLREMSAGRVSR